MSATESKPAGRGILIVGLYAHQFRTLQERVRRTVPGADLRWHPAGRRPPRVAGPVVVVLGTVGHALAAGVAANCPAAVAVPGFGLTRLTKVVCELAGGPN